MSIEYWVSIEIDVSQFAENKYFESLKEMSTIVGGGRSILKEMVHKNARGRERVIIDDCFLAFQEFPFFKEIKQRIIDHDVSDPRDNQKDFELDLTMIHESGEHRKMQAEMLVTFRLIRDAGFRVYIMEYDKEMKGVCGVGEYTGYYLHADADDWQLEYDDGLYGGHE